MATTHRLQISAHGMKQDDDRYTIPDSWNIAFFVKMGEILDYQKSIDIYNMIRQKDWDKLEKQVVHKYFGGAQVDDYALWDLGDKNYPSGVLLTTDKSQELVVDISGKTTQQKPIKLSALLEQAMKDPRCQFAKEDEVIVYFNACRE